MPLQPLPDLQRQILAAAQNRGNAQDGVAVFLFFGFAEAVPVDEGGMQAAFVVAGGAVLPAVQVAVGGPAGVLSGGQLLGLFGGKLRGTALADGVQLAAEQQFVDEVVGLGAVGVFGVFR